MSPFVEIPYTDRLRKILKDRNKATLANSLFPEGNQNRLTLRTFGLKDPCPPVTIIRAYIPEMNDSTSQNEREYKVYAHGRKEDVERLREMIG